MDLHEITTLGALAKQLEVSTILVARFEFVGLPFHIHPCARTDSDRTWDFIFFPSGSNSVGLVLF